MSKQGDVVVWQDGYFWGIGVNMGSYIWADDPSHHCLIKDYGWNGKRWRKNYDAWYDSYIKNVRRCPKWGSIDYVKPIGRFLNEQK